MKIESIILYLAFLVSCNYRLAAQLSEPSNPGSFRNDITDLPTFVDLPHVYVSRLIEEDQNNNGYKSLRYAEVILTKIDIINSGTLNILPDGTKILRIGIRSAGAYSLSVVFNDYNIPEGAAVFLYNIHKSDVLGAFTSKNNDHGKILPTAPVPGDEIIIEYNEPVNSAFIGNLVVSQVCHDYKGIFSYLAKDGNFGHSGSCNIDINCNQGIDWQKEKHSVCRMITGGILCTGTLLNNTSWDAKPYFLTAHHCISTQTAASNMVLFFNYESPTCHGTDGLTNQTVAGATLKATTPNLDFCLLELSETPPASYNPYYAGWSISEIQAKRSVCIHHPQGDVKKISKDDDPPVTGNYGAGFDHNSHWLITSWELATTEGGSSGSPIFDEQHRVTGDLTGGEATCSNSVNDYFAKLYMSWNDYSNNNQQLKFWLDPDNTGETAINGFDPFWGSNPPQTNFKATPTVIMVGGSVDFTDISEGNVTSWNWSFPGAETAVSNLQYPAGIVYNTPGAYEVTLSAGNGFGNDTETKTSYILVAEGCVQESNIIPSEDLALYGFGGGEWGYWSGHNQHNFTEFAEKYSNLSEHYIHGLYITPGRVYHSNYASKITLKIWSGSTSPVDELYSQDVYLSQLDEGVMTYLSFAQTVETNGSFFAGYKIYYNNADTFAVLHSEPRGAGGLNTCFVKINDVWNPVNDFSQTFTISLSVEPKVCGLENIESIGNTSMINIFPNPSTGKFSITFSAHHNKTTGILIYNILGEKILSINTDKCRENIVMIDLNDKPAGIYLIRVFSENKVTEKKILIFR